MQIIDSNWRPRRDLNPCYRRESHEKVALHLPVWQEFFIFTSNQGASPKVRIPTGERPCGQSVCIVE